MHSQSTTSIDDRSRRWLRLLPALALACDPAVDSVSSEDRDEQDEQDDERTFIRFPADAGVVDVTSAPYGAVPDDGVDDTLAIQRALDDHPSGNHIIYFPPGEYLVSSTLRPALDDGVTKRNVLQGAGEDLTTIALAAGAGLTDAIIDFRSGPAQFFRNGVRDLTLEVRPGNPEASGLKFNASNQGTVRNVTIRSLDGTGRVGLDMSHSGEIGPLLVERLTVEGFEVGIDTAFQTASQTFEDVTLSGQSRFGWVNSSVQTVFVRGLTSVNEVTAFANIPFGGQPGEGQVLLIDGTLTNPAASGGTAIRNQKSMVVRNVTTSGYEIGVSRELTSFRGNAGLPDGLIEEYWANGVSTRRRGGTFSLFESPDATLGLPVQPTPEIAWHDLGRWAGPHQFGGAPDDGVDDSAAIQAAIDSGASTIYLPRGRWTLDGVIELRGNAQRLIGTESRLTGSGTVRIADGEESVVSIERLELTSARFEHDSSRTLVLADLLGGRYVPKAARPGDVFVRDCLLNAAVFRDQRAWMRQINIEGDTEADPSVAAKIVNDGADVWILGLKTEDDGTQIATINGGRTELLGALHVGGFGVEPRFVTEEAAFSAAIVPGPRLVRETRGGVTREGELSGDVYSAFDADAQWETTGTIEVDNRSVGAELTGPWTTSSSFQGGFIGSDFAFARGAEPAVARFRTSIPVDGEYEIFARWIRDNSGQDHSGHASNATFSFESSAGAVASVVDQRGPGGAWVSLGVHTLASGDHEVTLDAASANGTVLADGVRWRLVAAAPAGD